MPYSLGSGGFLFLSLGSGGSALPMLVVFGALALGGFWMMRGLAKAASGHTDGPETEVARLRVALLADPELQKALRSLGESADTSTTEGLATLMEEASLALLRQASAWKFADFESQAGSLQQAQATFDRWMTEDRSTYQTEVLRNFENQHETTTYTFKHNPDDRYLVVSLVLAVRGGFGEVTKPLQDGSIKQALLAFSSATPASVLAAHLSWTPEAPGEALDEEALLLHWPRLELL